MCQGSKICTCGDRQGVYRIYGDDNLPIDQGLDRRFQALGTVEQDALFDPMSGFPFMKLGSFNEVSQMGKMESLQYVTSRLNPQHTEDADARGYIFLAPPIIANQKITSAGVIEPWDTVKGNVNAFSLLSGAAPKGTI